MPLSTDQTDALEERSSPNHATEINQELYKRNLELAVVNKTLSLLRKLYQISLLVLNPETLFEKISETIRTELGMEMVGAFTYDKAADTLVPFVFSKSDRFQEFLNKEGIIFRNFPIATVSQKPFLHDVIINSANKVTKNLSDIWGGVIEHDTLKRLAEESRLRSILLYPLVTPSRSIGILVLGFNREYDDLTEHEKSAINSITDVIALALDKAYLYKDLQTANEGQTNLIHIINHQIKGYLSKARNIFSEFLSPNGMYKDAVTGRAQELSGQGFEVLTEGVRFVQSVLNASSIEKGTIQYDKQTFDLRALLQEIEEPLKSTAERKGLVWESCFLDGDFRMVGDRVQLKEVFNNVIDNAIRYTLKGKVSVKLAREHDKAVFTVTDTGIGLNQEDRQKLFTRGGRGKNSTRINVDSTGYGLFFVKGVVEAHGGTVTLDSQGEGTGTTCTVVLPITTKA